MATLRRRNGDVNEGSTGLEGARITYPTSAAARATESFSPSPAKRTKRWPLEPDLGETDGRPWSLRMWSALCWGSKSATTKASSMPTEETDVRSGVILNRFLVCENEPCRATALAVMMLSPESIQTSFPLARSAAIVSAASGRGGSAMANRATIWRGDDDDGTSVDADRLLTLTRTTDFASCFHRVMRAGSIPSGLDAESSFMKTSLPIAT